MRLVLVHQDGCAHFVSETKKGQEFLSSLLLIARCSNICVSRKQKKIVCSCDAVLFISIFLALCSDSTQPKNQVPVLRSLSNLLAHECGAHVMHKNRQQVRINEIHK